MKVSQILERKGSHCHSIEPDKSLSEAVAVMMQHRIGSLLVIDKGTLVSIVTERDVMWSVNEHGAKVIETIVADVMARELVTCNGDCSLADAMDLMTKNVTGRRIRHLPVVEGERLLGLISIGDIVNTLLREAEFENKLLRNYIRNWPEESA